MHQPRFDDGVLRLINTRRTTTRTRPVAPKSRALRASELPVRPLYHIERLYSFLQHTLSIGWSVPSCVCLNFGPASSVIELATGTILSIENARKTWVPVGSVAYNFVWITCTIEVGFRTYVNSHIQGFLDEQDYSRTVLDIEQVPLYASEDLP